MVRLLALAGEGMDTAEEQGEPEIKVVAIDDTLRMGRRPAPGAARANEVLQGRT